MMSSQIEEVWQKYKNHQSNSPEAHFGRMELYTFEAGNEDWEISHSDVTLSNPSIGVGGHP